MGKVLNLIDKLSNVMSGKGTTIDRSIYAHYNFLPVEPQQAEAAYRTSWLMRKIVDIPPLDMTRAWRQWQAGKDVIEALEREERRLQLREKVKRALVLARLWGGSAIVMGVKGDEPTEPLDINRVGKDGLAWMHVFSRYQITAGQMVLDPADEWFGQPQDYSLTTGQGAVIRIHPSRGVPFIGQRAPEGSLIDMTDWFWGDPLYQSIQSALQNADLAQDGFAALIDEAKLDIIKIPDLMQNVGSAEYEDRLLARLGAAASGKSTWRALMLDGAEEWDQRQVNWTGMPDIITSYLQMVAGAADIPITRLLGTSPKGLQSTGEGEERDYHAMIAARQDEMLAPALDRIDEVMIRSALGNRPSDIWYKFNPLSQLAPKDAAEVEKKRAETVKTYGDTGLFPEDALAAMAKNAVIESGYFPGSEAAFEQAQLEAPFEQEPDPDELLTAEEIAARAKGGDRTSAGSGRSSPSPRRAANDAAPRTLYVSRKVQNVDEIKAWAKSQGLPELQDDLHVTIIYSRTAMDWIKAGNASEWGEKDGKLTIAPGGPRAIEPLGDRTAVILFASSELYWRHKRIIEAGAAHGYDDYQPHISLTGEPVDLAGVEPYRGKIVLGPEIFEEIKA